MAAAVEIPPRTKILFDAWKTFYENDQVYAPVSKTLEEGSYGSGYVPVHAKNRWMDSFVSLTHFWTR